MADRWKMSEGRLLSKDGVILLDPENFQKGIPVWKIIGLMESAYAEGRADLQAQLRALIGART